MSWYGPAFTYTAASVTVLLAGILAWVKVEANFENRIFREI
jgi:hypothetical protein